jgi:hypothetical protein
MTNVKGSKEQQRKVLNLKETLALNSIVVKRYKQSGLGDTEFAENVNLVPNERKLFRFDLNATHISTARDGADIQSNTQRRTSSSSDDCFGLTARVAQLEEQLEKLTTYIMNKKVG